MVPTRLPSDMTRVSLACGPVAGVVYVSCSWRIHRTASDFPLLVAGSGVGLSLRRVDKSDLWGRAPWPANVAFCSEEDTMTRTLLKGENARSNEISRRGFLGRVGAVGALACALE